jgi:hypothetical protein
LSFKSAHKNTVFITLFGKKEALKFVKYSVLQLTKKETMETNESKKIIASDQKGEFRSIEATVNLKRDPLEIRVLGSLYLNWALSDSRLTRVEKANEPEDLLILEFTSVTKTISDKGVFNIFQYVEKIDSPTKYKAVKICFEGQESVVVSVSVTQ